MPNNPEEPRFLQDIIVPPEHKGASQGFDIDREFGKGAREYIEKTLQEVYFRPPFTQLKDSSNLIDALKAWRILFDKNPQEWLDALRAADELPKLTRASLGSGDYLQAAEYLSGCVTLFGKNVFAESFWKSPEINLLEQFLKGKINSALASKDDLYYAAAAYAPQYRIIFGGTPWTDEQEEKILKLLQDFFPRDREAGFHFGVFLPAYYRILRAYDVRSTDQGIEIIDPPPSPYAKPEVPPMPEERAF